MSHPPSETDQALTDLAIEQTQAGNIQAAKITASQITGDEYRRWAWMQILYAQLYILNDLAGVKETVLSLPDSSLWIGSWVHDLVLFTARSGDIDGAKLFIEKLPKNSAHGHLMMLIVSVQAQQGDYSGAESTLTTLRPDNPWHDFALLQLVQVMAERGDIVKTEAIVARIADPEIKSTALTLCDSVNTKERIDSQN